MFDISFWELLLLAVVTLLVMGPERMPRALGQAGRVIAGLRRRAFSLRRQLDALLWPGQGPGQPGQPEQGELQERLEALDDLLEGAPDRKQPPG